MYVFKRMLEMQNTDFLKGVSAYYSGQMYSTERSSEWRDGWRSAEAADC